MWLCLVRACFKRSCWSQQCSPACSRWDGHLAWFEHKMVTSCCCLDFRSILCCFNVCLLGIFVTAPRDQQTPALAWGSDTGSTDEDDTLAPGGEDPRGRETLKSRAMWLWAFDGDRPVERLLDTHIKGLTGKCFLVQNSAFSSA